MKVRRKVKSTEDSEQQRPEPVIKAHFIGADTAPMSNVRKKPNEEKKRDALFSQANTVEPPYNQADLFFLFDHSNSLRSNIDSYKVNVDGHGHHFDPVIDLDTDDVEEKIRNAIYLERLSEAEESEDGSTLEIEFPNDQEVAQRIEQMRTEMAIEKSRLDAFFRFCCVDESFISLRMKKTHDREICGNAYWEVLRNKKGEPALFNYVPASTIRLLPLEATPIQVKQKVKRAPLSYEEITVFKRFRRYVQITENSGKVYFKEFGDPRTVSAYTGKIYKDIDEMKRSELESLKGVEPVPATEVLTFVVHSSLSPYGVPRWIGNMLSVIGSRQSEEVNFLYFENKSVPPMVVTVSGGRITESSVKRIEKFIENKIRGRQNFHKILVIEAVQPEGVKALDASQSALAAKIEIKPLAQIQDGLFQDYDARNIDKVGMSFRLPRLLRGDIRDFNRATAEASLEFAESQVFSPDRSEFDWTINRKIFPDLNIRYWEFVSNSPTSRNPIDLTEIITSLVKESIITIEEAREFAQGIFNRDFKKLEAAWAKIPTKILEIEAKSGPTPTDGQQETEPSQAEPQAKSNLKKLASELVKLRVAFGDELKKSEETRVEPTIEELEREVIKLPLEEFSKLVELS